ncbi:hypothetical protein [Streptomyces sp. NPDC001404]|uniref:hypothetical protein n=1 Tax=Streptomyces sp. NPDC001404 TaxID=3364571 RepID=UPI003675E4EC
MTVTPLYELVSFRLKTGAVLDYLPVSALSYTETLNAAGSMSATVPLDAPGVTPDSLAPGGTGLMVLRGGVPIWGGILWTLAADLAAGTITLNASGFHTHYAGKHFVNGETKDNVDQGAALREWFARSNAPGSNGIGTDTSQVKNTGRKVSRSWTRYECMSVAAAIEDLADDAGGFHFRYVPYWAAEGTKVGNRFLITGVSESVSRHTLEHRINCNVTGVSYDSSVLTTNVYTFGADDNSGSKPTVSASNPDLSALIPAKDVVLTFSDVKDIDTLAKKAAAAISIGRAPIAIPTLTLYPGMFSPADFMPGDVTTVRVDAGYVRLFNQFVVTERRVDVASTGVETIGLALANRELFENGNTG